MQVTTRVHASRIRTPEKSNRDTTTIQIVGDVIRHPLHEKKPSSPAVQQVVALRRIGHARTIEAHSLVFYRHNGTLFGHHKHDRDVLAVIVIVSMLNPVRHGLRCQQLKLVEQVIGTVWSEEGLDFVDNLLDAFEARWQYEGQGVFQGSSNNGCLQERTFLAVNSYTHKINA